MPYTPVATNVTEPADTGAAASTAAAEFRALKLYIRDVILADLNTKREQTDYLFGGGATFLAGLVSSLGCQANSFTCATSTGYAGIGGFAAGSTDAVAVGAANGALGWVGVHATAVQITSLLTPVTCDGHTGNITLAAFPTANVYYVFTVNNNKVKAGDLVVVGDRSITIPGQTIPQAYDVQAGSFKVRFLTPTGFDGASVPAIGFAILKRSAP